MSRRFVLFVAAMLAAAGCGRRPTVYSETRFVLGPVAVRIQVVATRRSQAERAMDRAFDAASRVNRLMSMHVAESEVSRLNRESGRECAVSAETAAVLRRAVEVAEQTDGAFDVTVGPVVKVWKETIETGKLPDADKLAAARKLVGYRKLVVGAGSAKLTVPGMSVDLGGIAKGYAVDKAVEALRACGITGALVDAGGDGYALGTRPDGSPWRVGIQRPGGEEGERRPEVLLLQNMAYATSGDYEQFVDIGGVRYAHIVDPRSGEPARMAVSVTVLAADCTTADAFATGVSVLGPERGVQAVERLVGVACMVLSGERDRPKAATSRGFNRFVSYEAGSGGAGQPGGVRKALGETTAPGR